MAGNATYSVNILLGLLQLLLLLAGAGQEQFADCSNDDSGFCIHGTCRLQILEDIISCMCSTGYFGDSCQHFGVIALFSKDREMWEILMFFMIPVLCINMAAIVCLCVRCCRRYIRKIEDRADTDGNIV